MSKLAVRKGKGPCMNKRVQGPRRTISLFARAFVSASATPHLHAIHVHAVTADYTRDNRNGEQFHWKKGPACVPLFVN